MKPREYSPLELQTPSEIVFDHERAFTVFDTVMDAYTKKQPPYNAVLPQEHKPDSMCLGGEHYRSTQHAMYFWNACAYMSSTNSYESFQKLTELFNGRPELFDCAILKDFDQNELSQILQSEGPPGRYNIVSNWWVTNARYIDDQFDGDPRKILKGANSYDDCLKRIAKNKMINGFQEKMVSMLLYFYYDEGLIDKINFPVPVDFHVQRIALATGIIQPGIDNFHRNDKIENIIRDLTYDYITVRQIDSRDLTNALWMLSNQLCSKSPGVKAYHKRDESGRHIYAFERIDPTMHNPQQRSAYRASCGRCILAAANLCSADIPSTPYYRQGAFKIITDGIVRSDDEFTQLSLSELSITSQTERRRA